MAEFIYQMYKARKAHGDKVILDDVTLSFYPGAKIGVVGPNGMGKSTLLKLMAGMEEVSNGEARLTPGYTVGILQQEPPLDEDKTVLENIELAFGDVKAKIDRFNEIGGLMAEPDADFDALMAEMGELQDAIDAVDGWDLDSQLSQAMDALQCPDPDMPVNVLSGGERRRVALCRLLLEAPDLLLLDEPTNHLDAESVLWLEQFLHKYQGAVLAVTHDRYFLDNVAEWICEVDRGHLYPYKGNYTTYLETKATRLASQKQRDERLAKRLSEELEWVRSSPKARQAKSRARLERYDQMVAEAAQSKKVDFTEIRIPAGPRLGANVLKVDGLCKSFGDRVLIDNLSFELPRNGIVGVIGPNGVGKSTLMGMMSRYTKADVNVIGLIGERGREVLEFMERDLGPEGMARSVLIIATSDQSPLVRMRAAYAATAVAEYFRDKGKDVLLMMDSVTRFAMAAREVGLAIGEPPTTKGYTPTVFAQLPKLLERAGRSSTGTITGVYTVLVDGDDFNEPIADAVRSILDGHIVLTRDLADQGHFPAIDVLRSISRLRSDICKREDLMAGRAVLRSMSTYRKVEDMVNIGAYARGSNPEIDEAIARMPRINAFLCQEVSDKQDVESSMGLLRAITEDPSAQPPQEQLQRVPPAMK